MNSSRPPKKKKDTLENYIISNLPLIKKIISEVDDFVEQGKRGVEFSPDEFKKFIRLIKQFRKIMAEIESRTNKQLYP